MGLILSLALCLLMSACLPLGRDEVTPPPAGDLSWLDLDGDGEVTFQGVVLENFPGCEVDAACFLRVRRGLRVVTVIYHYGEWPPCDNNEATTQGFGVAEGDRVEVFGVISTGSQVSTCELESYYIKKPGSE